MTAKSEFRARLCENVLPLADISLCPTEILTNDISKKLYVTPCMNKVIDIHIDYSYYGPV